MGRYKEVSCFACVCLAPYFYLLFSSDVPSRFLCSILLSLGMSVLAFMATFKLIPSVATHMLKRDLIGFDVNKKGTAAGSVKVPESMGLIAGAVYLVFVIAVLAWQQDFFSQSPLSLQEFSVALASIGLMLLLGFVDDVLDLSWRIKLFSSIVAAMLLVMAYSGGTTIVLLGRRFLDLGWVYRLCIGFLVVFFTNAVNIYAGINGLEAGQTVVIACSILTFNLVNIMSASADPGQQLAHMFSIHLMQPLIAVSLGLLSFNWYPSSVFVGDSFTYFAGMTLAVAAVFGHFSETLFCFMVPQLLNFACSLPQLFKILPCPRHRLPRFDRESGLLIGSIDLNLINLFLRFFGRCSEYSLFLKLMVFQAIFCILTILLQVGVATISETSAVSSKACLQMLTTSMVVILQTVFAMWLLSMLLLDLKGKSCVPPSLMMPLWLKNFRRHLPSKVCLEGRLSHPIH